MAVLYSSLQSKGVAPYVSCSSVLLVYCFAYTTFRFLLRFHLSLVILPSCSYDSCTLFCYHSSLRVMPIETNLHTFAVESTTYGQDPLSPLLLGRFAVLGSGFPAPQSTRCAPSRPNRQACACDHVLRNPGVGLRLWYDSSSNLRPLLWVSGGVLHWLRVRISEVRVSPRAAPLPRLAGALRILPGAYPLVLCSPSSCDLAR